MRRTQASSQVDHDDRPVLLTARARKLRGKGELRRAVVALREACLLDEASASRWMLLAALLADLGRAEEAVRAMKQSLYLREQAGDERRAGVVRAMLAKLPSDGDSRRADWRHGVAAAL